MTDSHAHEAMVNVAPDVRLWTSREGSGTPVLIVQGGPGMADYAGPLASLIADRYQTLRYEQRGCGRSDQGASLTVDTFLDDIEQLRREWRVDTWAVLGHSWGADLAVAYALRHPAQVSRLVCVSGGRIHSDRDWHRTYRALREHEVLPTMAVPPNEGVNAALNASWHAFCREPDLLRRLADAHLPVHFLYGDRDIRPPWPTEQLAALLPNAQMVVLESCGHYPWLDAAELTQQALYDALEGGTVPSR